MNVGRCRDSTARLGLSRGMLRPPVQWVGTVPACECVGSINRWWVLGWCQARPSSLVRSSDLSEANIPSSGSSAWLVLVLPRKWQRPRSQIHGLYQLRSIDRFDQTQAQSESIDAPLQSTAMILLCDRSKPAGGRDRTLKAGMGRRSQHRVPTWAIPFFADTRRSLLASRLRLHQRKSARQQPFGCYKSKVCRPTDFRRRTPKVCRPTVFQAPFRLKSTLPNVDTSECGHRLGGDNSINRK